MQKVEITPAFLVILPFSRKKTGERIPFPGRNFQKNGSGRFFAQKQGAIQRRKPQMQRQTDGREAKHEQDDR